MRIQPPIVLLLSMSIILGSCSAPQGEGDSSAEPTHDSAAARGSLAPNVAQTVRLDVGLNSEEEALWHHHDEGSGFLPLSFFHALTDASTGQTFLESLPHYGFVPNPANAYGLPIGLSAAPLAGAPTKSILVGVSCAACHSGLYTYGDTAMLIDGAPNMLDFEALLDGLEASLSETLKSPRKTFELLTGIMQWERRLNAVPRDDDIHPTALTLAHEAATAEDGHALGAARDHLESSLHAAFHADDPTQASAHLSSAADGLHAVTAADHADESTWQHLREGLPKLEHDIGFIKRRAERLLTLSEAFSNETEGGPGRADSFDSIWDLLIQHDNLAPMNAPVSIPHLFDYASFHWVHWDGNSSAVMGRDYAQAIALGADFEPETLHTTVLPHNVIALERTAHQFGAPAWPSEILGAIDTEKASRGETLYTEHCLACHSEETLTPVDEIGTDPQRAVNFAKLAQDGKSYAQLLIDLGNTVARKSLEAHGITQEELAPIERSADPTWRITHAYHTRTLRGIWASPPYLHNGSVPTLWDLLQPASARPASFPVGRALDPQKVGIDVVDQGTGAWIFRIDGVGNANTGHEYGTDLPDADKWALVEYMKSL